VLLLLTVLSVLTLYDAECTAGGAMPAVSHTMMTMTMTMMMTMMIGETVTVTVTTVTGKKLLHDL
jgi:hypothetical protein